MLGRAAPTATVHLPGPLRDLTGGRPALSARGETVRALIDDLERRHPGLGFRLCEETGTLRPFVNIFVENENVRDLQGLDTPVPGGARVFVLHSVAGGAGSPAGARRTASRSPGGW